MKFIGPEKYVVPMEKLRWTCPQDIFRANVSKFDLSGIKTK